MLLKLETLDVSSNKSLPTIEVNVINLPKLRILNCDSCESLTSPPLEVCTQGLPAMRKYLQDIGKDSKSNMKFIPVTVIGQSMAGKTSLIRSLQEGRRVLTNRSMICKLDEATKVLKVSEASIHSNSKLVFHDFGGQAIYHAAYQLSSRSRFVPLLVINVFQFDQIANDKGLEVACKEVCFEWLSHLFLMCPAIESLQREKPIFSTRPTVLPFSNITFSPMMPISATPSATYFGISSSRRNSSSRGKLYD